MNMQWTEEMTREGEIMQQITSELFPVIARLNHNYGTKHLIGVLACFVTEMAEQQDDPDGAIREFVSMMQAVRERDEKKEDVP